MSARKQSEGLYVTEDEALEIMAVGLMRAAAMFANVAEAADTRQELARVLTNYAGYDTDPAIAAGLAFYDNIFESYEEMKRND